MYIYINRHEFFFGVVKFVNEFFVSKNLLAGRSIPQSRVVCVCEAGREAQPIHAFIERCDQDAAPNPFFYQFRHGVVTRVDFCFDHFV